MRCPIDPQARPLPGTFEVSTQTAHTVIHINPTHPDHITAFSSPWALPQNPPQVTVHLLSNLGTFVIRIRILCILHVSCMYSACILMCPVKYIKIHFSIAFRYIRVQDACILMYPDKADMYPVLHQGSA